MENEIKGYNTLGTSGEFVLTIHEVYRAYEVVANSGSPAVLRSDFAKELFKRQLEYERDHGMKEAVYISSKSGDTILGSEAFAEAHFYVTGQLPLIIPVELKTLEIRGRRYNITSLSEDSISKIIKLDPSTLVVPSIPLSDPKNSELLYQKLLEQGYSLDSEIVRGVRSLVTNTKDNFSKLFKYETEFIGKCSPNTGVPRGHYVAKYDGIPGTDINYCAGGNGVFVVNSESKLNQFRKFQEEVQSTFFIYRLIEAPEVTQNGTLVSSNVHIRILMPYIEADLEESLFCLKYSCSKKDANSSSGNSKSLYINPEGKIIQGFYGFSELTQSQICELQKDLKIGDRGIEKLIRDEGEEILMRNRKIIEKHKGFLRS